MEYIRIGFVNVPDQSWMGGVNYLKNILYAIELNEHSCLKPYVFLDKKFSADIRKEYGERAKVVESFLLNKTGLFAYASRNIRRVFKNFFPFNTVLGKSNIKVLSHFSNEFGRGTIKQVGWIPDFQHVHLPQMFSEKVKKRRDQNFLEKISNSSLVILSSRQAYEDFKQFAPDFANKGRILNFVSQPDSSLYNLPADYTRQVMEKYSIQKKFFFLPNQFWKHKNHLSVFKALEILKNKGVKIKLVCSGKMDGPTVTEHSKELIEYIDKAGLDSQVTFLGLIDYKELMVLARNCISVINPSLFEGWSSTVEECKSMGKNMLLSNIPVHLEQSPPGSIYVDPEDPEDIARALHKNWEDLIPGPDYELEKKAKLTLKSRTLEFAMQYENIVNEVLSQ
ncbi:MAG: glycosyltransferase family 1 protein [Leptospirales bacterium]